VRQKGRKNSFFVKNGENATRAENKYNVQSRHSVAFKVCYDYWRSQTANCKNPVIGVLF